MVVATWLRWLPLMVIMDFKEITVGTEETEEIATEMAIPMVVVPTSMKISAVVVAKGANQEIPLISLLLLLDNSLFLT